MKKINVLLVLVLVVFVATLAGCKKTSAVEDKPVASETVSSEETSSEVSEEPSEEVSEEISEEVSEEEVVEIDLSKYSADKGKAPADLAKEMNYKELRVVAWNANKGALAILADGDSFVEEDSNTYMLVFPKKVKDATIVNGEFRIEQEDFNVFLVYTAEDAYDVTCEVTYEDGTTETITVNITLFK